MRKEKHPFKPFIPKKAKYLILGTFPPSGYGKKKLKNRGINFYYGSKKNLFWKLIGDMFYDCKKYFKNKYIIEKFLETKKIAITDVFDSCTRKNKTADDSALRNTDCAKVISNILKNKKIIKIFFTSKETENKFYKKIIKDEYDRKEYKNDRKIKYKIKNMRGNYKSKSIEGFILPSPSHNCNKSIVKYDDDYKKKKQKYKKCGTPTYCYRLEIYKKAFKSI